MRVGVLEYWSLLVDGGVDQRDSRAPYQRQHAFNNRLAMLLFEEYCGH